MTRSFVSRRSFLKTSTAVAATIAAGPVIVPSRVLGKSAPSNNVHLAMFGVGARGYGVMTGFAHCDDARFVMVVDPFKSRRDKAAGELNRLYNDNSVAAVADYREVMPNTDVDAIVACTVDHWHVPLAIAAANSGKDAYIEKPLGPSLAWHKRLREAMARNGRIMQYGTQQRSSPTFRYVCEIVRNGYLGKIKHVEAWCIDGTRAKEWMTPASTIVEPVPADLDYDLWLGPSPDRPYSHFRVNREGSFHCYDHSIGFLGGWGAHPLDIAQWGLDADNTSPIEYEGTGWIPTAGLYSTVCGWDVRCRYANGVTMRFMSERPARPVISKYRTRLSDHGTTFFGEEGWISVDRSGIEASDPRLLSIRLRPTDLRLPHSNHHDQNFVDCVRTRRQPVSHLEAAIRSDTISHLSDLTVRLGRPIKWDPMTETAVDDEQANRMLNRAMRPPYQF